MCITNAIIIFSLKMYRRIIFFMYSQLRHKITSIVHNFHCFVTIFFYLFIFKRYSRLLYLLVRNFFLLSTNRCFDHCLKSIMIIISKIIIIGHLTEFFFHLKWFAQIVLCCWNCDIKKFFFLLKCRFSFAQKLRKKVLFIWWNEMKWILIFSEMKMLQNNISFCHPI